MYDDAGQCRARGNSAGVETIYTKALSVSNSAERQRIVLSNGEEISARLVVLANGLNVGLRHKLGIERRIVSACHSITLGFDVAPVGRPSFGFPALTYFSERPSDRIAYLSLFPVGSGCGPTCSSTARWTIPGCSEMRRAPEADVQASLPRLRRITGEFAIAGDIKIRPADLYVSDGPSPAGRGAGRRRLRDHLPGDAEPALTRCSPTSSGSATSTSRTGLPPTAWPETRSLRSTTIRSSAPATPGRSPRPKFPLGVDRQRPLLAGPALGALSAVVAREGVMRRLRARLNIEPRVRAQSSSSSSSSVVVGLIRGIVRL